MDAGDRLIDEYALALGRALSGPRRLRRDLVSEVRGHLIDATEAYESAGSEHRAAVERAVQEFGPVKHIAKGYQTVLAVAASRRSSITLLALLLPQAFLWDNGLRLVPSTKNSDVLLADFLHFAIEWFGFAALSLAIVTLLIAGIGQRWVAVGPGFARWTGVFVAVGAIGSGLLGLCLLVLSGASSMTLWMLVLVLLVLPMAWTVHTARLCLRAA